MKLIPNDSRFPDLHEEVVLIFRDVQLESVPCDLCGDYHPPDIHLRPITPVDPIEPEEA
jgi:hypothetical protein